jgi:hypothetical protein
LEFNYRWLLATLGTFPNMLGMASPIDARDNSKLNQRRLLYPIIGSGNASQFENQHERLTMMRKSSVRKDARSNISSSPEKTRRGKLPCGTKAAFFKSVREQLQDPTMSDVLKNNVLASLLTALTSKKLAFVDLSGYDVFQSRLAPTLLRLVLRNSLLAEETNNNLGSAMPKLAFSILSALLCEKDCAVHCIAFGVAKTVCTIVFHCIKLLKNHVAPQNLTAMAIARTIDEDDVCFNIPYVGLTGLKYFAENCLSQPETVPRFRQEQMIYGGPLHLFIWLQRLPKGNQGEDVALAALKKMKILSYSALKLFPKNELNHAIERYKNGIELSRLCLPNAPQSKADMQLDDDPAAINIIEGLHGHLDLIELKEERERKKLRRRASQAEIIDQMLIETVDAEGAIGGHERRRRLDSIDSQFSSPRSRPSPRRAQKGAMGTPVAKKPKPRSARQVFSFDYLPQSVLAYLQHIKNLSIGLVGLDELLKGAEREMDVEQPELHRRGKRIARRKVDPSGELIKQPLTMQQAPPPILERIGRPMTTAEKIRAEKEAEWAAKRAEELKEKRRLFQKELGQMKMVVGSDGKIIRDPDALKKEAARLRKEFLAKEAAEKRKREAEQEIIRKQVEGVRRRVEEQIAEKERAKNERMRNELLFANKYRNKIEREKNAVKAEQFEIDRRVKYKAKLLEDKELAYKAHQAKYASEGRTTLVARVEKKERARARQLKKEADDREHKKKLAGQRKRRMKEARLKRKEIEKKEHYRYRARKLRWIEHYEENEGYSYWENQLNGTILYESPLEDYGVDIYEEYHAVWYKYYPSTDADDLGEKLGGDWYRTVEALEEEREARALQKAMEEYYESRKDEYGGYYDEYNGYVDKDGCYTDAEGYFYDAEGNFVEFVGVPYVEKAPVAYVPPPPPKKKGMPGYVPPPPPKRKGMPGYVPPPPPKKKGMSGYVPPPPPRV